MSKKSIKVKKSQALFWSSTRGLATVGVGVFAIAALVAPGGPVFAVTSSSSDSSSSSSSSSKSLKGAAASICGDKGRKTGKLGGSKLKEVSGIAASSKSEDAFWVHNDSKNGAEIYAINSAGKQLAAVKIKGAKNVDWEDIDIAKGKLYIADTGTNKTKQPTSTIYTITEPAVKSGSATAKAIKFKTIGNTEAMFVDKSGVIYLANKNTSGKSAVYKLSGTTPTKVASLSFGKGEEIVAADMARDGSAIVFRSYKKIYVYSVTGSVASALKKKPACTITGHNGAGKNEAVGFTADSKALITTGEGKGAPIDMIGSSDSDSDADADAEAEE